MATGSNLDEFLADLARYAAAEVLTAQLTADTLRKYLRAGLIVPEDLCAGDTEGYSQRLLHAEPTHSVVALTWLPGQSTPIHDHVAWCVSGVVEGVEVDEAFRLWRLPRSGRRVLAPYARTTCSAGRVQLLVPPDEDIHRVSNGGTGRAVSLHVYGADISQNMGTSINRVFGQAVVDRPPDGARLVSWRSPEGLAP
ncbi:cysteine dioxygenase family protein [Kitasatospora sp. NPDC028055]|uniref:cysteine dioxygenase family protein n=1 Tax=Kitasatospora sp. NPDC028055 TaxID=3155653 RepID=UPI0033F41199